LYALETGNAAYRRMYLTTMLQAAKFRGGLDKPLATGKGTAYAIAAKFGPEVIDDVLAGALNERYLPAAAAAAQILGDIGSPALLARNGASPAALTVAAGHPNSRVRFAGTQAIMQLKPTQPFAGSSDVVDSLGYLASAFGAPRVLVAHPSSIEAQQMAGLCAALGYESDIATNGRRTLDLARRSADYEFALISSTIDRPAVDELLAQLRRDRRTSLLPVGVVAPPEDMERVKRFAAGSTRAVALLQPNDEEQMKLWAQEITKRAGRWQVLPAEREAQANAALDWLVKLAHSNQKVFDLHRLEPTVARALYAGALGPRAAQVLGQLGTASGQRNLLELADAPTQPLAARQTAVSSLAASIRDHGIMLTREEIMRQYDLYNANAGRDADSNDVLGAILDALEQRTVAKADQ
jgi:CheY-like chemotaxis protein